ncbi:MAG: hypothetical protein AB8B87_03665 [Granulosicoccus sp.]
METMTNYRIKVSSKHPHVAARIRSLLVTSSHNENSLAENEYDLFECGDEVVFISVSRHDQLQTMIEYEAIGAPEAHTNFVDALMGFPDTGVRVLEEKTV